MCDVDLLESRRKGGSHQQTLGSEHCVPITHRTLLLNENGFNFTVVFRLIGEGGSYVVSGTRPSEKWKEGLGNRLGRKCTIWNFRGSGSRD